MIQGLPCKVICYLDGPNSVGRFVASGEIKDGDDAELFLTPTVRPCKIENEPTILSTSSDSVAKNLEDVDLW